MGRRVGGNGKWEEEWRWKAEKMERREEGRKARRGGKETKKNERMSMKTYDQQRWNDMEIPCVKVFQVLGVRLISTQIMAK